MNCSSLRNYFIGDSISNFYSENSFVDRNHQIGQLYRGALFLLFYLMELILS